MPVPYKTHSIDKDYDVRWHSKLGTGINGDVVMCICRKTLTRHALKCLRPREPSIREIELQYLCGAHQNVVNVNDCYDNTLQRPGEREPTRWLLLVMEYMAGGELFDRIKEKRHFTEKEAAAVTKQVASAIAHLHKHDIAHRDLKPENLLYASKDEEAELKLADFGFAKLDRGDLVTPVYTPYYVPQEILKAQRVQSDKKSGLLPQSTIFAYDKSCDMWSLGVILYILLCGYPPFASEVQSTQLSEKMKQKIAKGEFTFHEKYWRGVSDEAKSVVSHLLSANPADRVTAEKLLTHPWVAGSSATDAVLESHQNLRADNQTADSKAGMAHYKEIMVKMRRPDVTTQKVDVKGGIEDLKARRKGAGAKAAGEKKKSRFFSKSKAAKAPGAGAGPDDAAPKAPKKDAGAPASAGRPTAGHKTRGGVAVGELVASVTMAFCTRDASASAEISELAQQAIATMETDLKLLQDALQKGGMSPDGSLPAGAAMDFNQLHQELGSLLLKDSKKAAAAAKPAAAAAKPASAAAAAAAASELL